MKFQLIRSATIKLYYNSVILLIDPYFAGKFTRDSYAGLSKNPLIDLPFAIEDIIKEIDAVIVSHLHSDHFDKIAKETIDKKTILFCQPDDEHAIKNDGFTNVAAIKDRIVFKEIEIRRFSGQHGYDGVLAEMGPVSGFVFRSKNDPTVCWLGDTVLSSAIEKLLIKEKPEVVIVHSCGAVWGNNVKIVFDEVQTIQICNLLPKSKIIATHMDSLDHGTVSRKRLREYAEKRLVNKSQLLIPDDGEIINL